MLNEHDLKDFERLPVRELYKVEPHTYVEAYNELFYFSHIDGMYSFCKNMAGDVVHLAAWTKVTPLSSRD